MEAGKTAEISLLEKQRLNCVLRAGKSAQLAGKTARFQFSWQTTEMLLPAPIFGEFDSGSERTLAAWIRHASRTEYHE